MIRRVLPVSVLLGFLICAVLPLIAVGVFGFSSATTGFTLEPVLELLLTKRAIEPIMNTVFLTLLTVVVGYLLVVPSLVWMHLRSPRSLPLAETASLLPYVIPAIALVGGVNLVLRPLFPGFFVSLYSLVPFYVLMTLPFLYRTVDSGLRSLELPTLFVAGASLGASPMRTFFTVVLPNLRASMISGSLLVVMMASGELVMASLLLHNTFPTLLIQLGQSQVRLAAALSFITIVGSWLIMAGMVVASRNRTAGSRTVPLVL
ncbi:ABC transporter permease [Leucobacter insecticola]|uniref:ABC transporter permease n=1 Tax=Leucobacter insecticola TaxID=2714934 RepID=A0A6G8FGE9_9MICO|nr:ABC transporter permease [Leucobacter insecticola]QIM15333.1 ABC transporter permease [Leucobacter insecticola]